MKHAKKFFPLIFAVLMTADLHATEKITIENSRLGLNIFTLKNGLTLFVIPDQNNALVNAKLVCKGGFSSQTPSTCGFFSMYSRLLTCTAKKQANGYFDLFPLDSECKADSTTYSATIASEETEGFMESMAELLARPEFSDSEIKQVLDEMKEETLDYAASTAGFINSSIDSRVFQAEPWKHDSGIYPALFSDYSVSQARTVLSNIGKSHYTPDNCALFLSGNIIPEQAYEAAEKAFATWHKTATRPSDFKRPEPKLDETRKYVLVSKDFSKELTQIVLQYTDLEPAHADILSASMNMEDSRYKKELSADPLLAIRGGDYLAAASTRYGTKGRLILQSLMESPYTLVEEKPEEMPSIAEQADCFASKACNSTAINRKTLVKAQELILDKFRIQTGNSRMMCDLLADWWPMASWTVPEEFYSGFQDKAYYVQTVSEKDISDSLKEKQPYVFILVNSLVYDQQKESFEKSGYILVNDKNSSWWTTQLLAKNAKAEKKALLKEEKKQKTKVIKSRPAEYYYANSIKTTREKTLSNGIPVIAKETKGSQTVAVSIAIAGGLSASPAKEKNLRTILVSALAKNSGIPGAEAITKETASYITYEVVKENLEASLGRLTYALVYGDIKPVQADRLFQEESYRTLMENANLENQMRNNVLAYLYRDTNIGQIYRDYDNKNNSASYQSLLTGYTEFLDASLYSIVICGDIGSKDAFKAAEKAFGILKPHKQRKMAELPAPQWKNKKRNIQLRHMYSSDLPPELAPKESPLLVPTKEFLDPVQLYFSAPEKNSDREIFNGILMELCARMEKEMDSYCRTFKATKTMPIAYIHGNKIRKANKFFDLYEKHRNALLENLSSPEKAEKTLRSIKTRYEIDLLEKTGTNTGTALLIQQSILSGSCNDYMNNYLELENADVEKIKAVLEEYIPLEPLMKVYSVDGEK
ncbi:MAG: insulinase family protein [Treponema sp.]|nr:insulinase family protein [Candidatus Treponema equi]